MFHRQSTVQDSSTYTEEEMYALVEEAREDERDDFLTEFRTAIENGQTIMSYIKEMYPDYLVVTSMGGYHWVEIDKSLAQNDYTSDNLVIDDMTGEYSYSQDGFQAQKGIDVSSHQGDIDWEAVASDGIEFAFVRAIYRGYESGKLVEDERCVENLQEANAAGISTGVYVFSQAITVEEAYEEADAALKVLREAPISLPVVYDVERVTSANARMNFLTVDERTDMALAFIDRIQSAGYDVMIYHNTEVGALFLDLSRLEGVDKWFAAYNNDLYWPYAYKVWQYSENGTVSGIDGKVDMDLWLVN